MEVVANSTNRGHSNRCTSAPRRRIFPITGSPDAARSAEPAGQQQRDVVDPTDRPVAAGDGLSQPHRRAGTAVQCGDLLVDVLVVPTPRRPDGQQPREDRPVQDLSRSDQSAPGVRVGEGPGPPQRRCRSGLLTGPAGRTPSGCRRPSQKADRELPDPRRARPNDQQSALEAPGMPDPGRAMTRTLFRQAHGLPVR